MSKDETPFGYVLGKDIEALPEPLRQFLCRTDECRYVGTCAVTRGSSKFSKIVGMIMRLPRVGTDMPFELTTRMAGGSILWRRSFNGKALTTRASIIGKRGQKKLMEKAGAATLFMRMAIESDQLVFRSTRAKFFGIPLPGFIAPRVEAFGFVEANNFVIESTTTLGRRRRLLRYQIQFDQTPVNEAQVNQAMVGEAKAGTATNTATSTGTATAAKTPVKDAVPNRPESGGEDETVVAGKAPPEGQSQVVPRPAPAGVATKPMRRENIRKPVKASDQEVPSDASSSANPAPPADEENAPEPVSRPRPAEPGSATVPLRPSRKRKLPETKPKD